MVAGTGTETGGNEMKENIDIGLWWRNSDESDVEEPEWYSGKSFAYQRVNTDGKYSIYCPICGRQGPVEYANTVADVESYVERYGWIVDCHGKLHCPDCLRAKQPAAGVWHSIDEEPPENETLLVKLQLEDCTSVYVAIKYSEDDGCMCGRWQIYPDDEGQLGDGRGKYPIIEWARIQKQDEVDN